MALIVGLSYPLRQQLGFELMSVDLQRDQGSFWKTLYQLSYCLIKTHLSSPALTRGRTLTTCWRCRRRRSETASRWRPSTQTRPSSPSGTGWRTSTVARRLRSFALSTRVRTWAWNFFAIFERNCWFPGLRMFLIWKHWLVIWQKTDRIDQLENPVLRHIWKLLFDEKDKGAENGMLGIVKRVFANELIEGLPNITMHVVPYFYCYCFK